MTRALVLLAVLAVSPAAQAGTGHPAGFTETRYGAAFTLGTAMAWAPDGSNRLFVTRQGYVRTFGPNNAAEIRIIKDGVLLPTPFATVTPVFNWSECGLFGIAFDPAFAQNGYVYVSACVSNSEQQIIRYTAVGDVGTQKTILLAGLPSAGDTHNGGGLSIGPDAKLYFAIGDNRATIGPDGDLTSARSKVSRANLDGTVPNDNPFFDGPGPNADFTWARGMRNPFTHAWQPGRNLLWVNDVGGHADQVFQVNAGEHGGWTMYGGGNQPLNHPLRYIRPVFQLMSGGPSGMAIAGSTFYDSTLFPAAYRGNYFVGDFEVPGRVLRAVLNPDNSLASQTQFVTDANFPLGFQVGPDGALYYLTYDPVEPATTGGVYRIDFTPTTQGIVVDTLHLRVLEGSTGVVSVRLALAPAAPVTVSVAHMGDADVTTPTTQLTFTAANWATPQNVVVSAAQDADGARDTATVTVSSSGLPSHDVAVEVMDDDTQVIVVSSAFVTLAEGGTTPLTVRLLVAPTSPVTVTVARTAGDTDVSPAAAMLTFDATTYQTPQTVMIAAAEDADSTADVATLTLSGGGATSRTIAVTVVDNENAAPTITTTPVTRAVAGNAYRYDADATGLPAPTFALPMGPPGMAIDATTGVVTWTAADAGDYPVTVRAQNGQMPSFDQAFTLTVLPDTAPYVRLSQPQPNAVVSGFIEFFGDAFDDAAVVRAEFLVDGNVVFDDVQTGDHFHYGGVNGHTSMRFDTRALSDGPHLFRMVAYDTRGQTGAQQAMVTVANAGVDAGSGSAGGAGGGSEPTAGGGAAGGSPVATAGGGTTPTTGGEVGGVCACTSGDVTSTAAAWLAALLLRRRRRARRESLSTFAAGSA
ncbi:MAG: PQQ-dependent sugar dehydrogenase [Myxococcaceae bacterium]|nr:PQQ-dependent sugar dehydrogenase [Myxococcaceae bacterium]